MSIGDRHRPLRDIVCDEIRTQIISGAQPPGTHLVEDRLAKDLGVSRNPVRESLRVLEAEGFVEMVPRKGAVVRTLSDDEVREIFEVRTALEALAARLAAARAKPEGCAEMSRILADAGAALAANDQPSVVRLNSEFHEHVLDASNNGYLRDVMLQLRGRMQWIFSRTAGTARGRHSHDEHRELAEAIRTGDGDRAAELAVAHVDAASRSYWDARAAADGEVTPGDHDLAEASAEASTA